MSLDFGKAISKPFSDVKTLGISSVLNIIPLVNLLVTGYVMTMAKDTMKGKNQLREWKTDSLEEYVVNAIMAIVIQLGYFIIPLIVMGIGIAGAIGIVLANPTNPDIPAILAVGGLPLMVGLLLALIAAFLVPMAMMKWIKSGEVGAAFKIGDVVKNCLTGDYIVAWIFTIVFALVVGFVLGMIGLMLLFIPGIGFILYLLLNGAMSFIITVVAYTLFAQTIK